MKKILFFLAFAALTLPALAQRRSEFVTDTAQTVFFNNVFYKDLFRVREDGTGQIPERTMIGDSSAYSRHQLSEYVGNSRQWASAAYEASLKNKLDKTLNNIQRETVANTGYNISDSLKYVYGDVYLGSWTYREGNNGTVTVTITRAANGNLRASGLPGAAGFTTLKVESDRHFEFRNYPTQGIHQVFVSQDSKTFRNADIKLNVTFKKSNQ